VLLEKLCPLLEMELLPAMSARQLSQDVAYVPKLKENAKLVLLDT